MMANAPREPQHLGNRLEYVQGQFIAHLFQGTGSWAATGSMVLLEITKIVGNVDEPSCGFSPALVGLLSGQDTKRVARCVPQHAVRIKVEVGLAAGGPLSQ